MKIYKTKLMKVMSAATDEKGTVMTAYLQIRIDNYCLWAFTADGWPIGDELLCFEGKTIPLRFVFLNLKTELSDERIKAIIPVDPNIIACDHYTVVGEIINKEPSPKLPDKYERFQVDCGFIVNELSAKKGEYDIGDFIRSEGRLDAYLVEEDELAKWGMHD
ncbi:MAG: hypothetical protein U9N61_12525 [Euryarchaeota archaeon]|nr:hypothetical protein [Euryarchaeota archaeon]